MVEQAQGDVAVFVVDEKADTVEGGELYAEDVGGDRSEEHTSELQSQR